MLEPKAVVEQPGSPYSVGPNEFQAQDRSFSKQGEGLNEKVESEIVNPEEQNNEWPEVQPTENLMNKALKLRKNNHALPNHYPHEWSESTRNAEHFGSYEKEMNIGKPRNTEILHDDSKPPLENIPAKAKKYQALEELEKIRPNELHRDEAVNRPNFPLFAKSDSTMAQAKYEVKEEKQPELERDVAQRSTPKVRINSWQPRLPVPIRNQKLMRSNTVVKPQQPFHDQQRIALYSGSSQSKGSVSQTRSAKNMVDIAANSPSFFTSEREQKDMGIYNGVRAPVKTVSVLQERTAPDSFVKKTAPFQQVDETSGPLEKWPGAKNVWSRQFLQQESVKARNGISSSLPAHQEQQSARDITPGGTKDIGKHKILIKQAAPSQQSLFLPKTTDYEKGPVKHFSEGMPEKREAEEEEEEADLAAILLPAQSKTAGLSKRHNSQPVDKNYRLPKLLHEERSEDLSATEEVAYPEETAVAFQPGLYGPKSAEPVNGRLEPKSLDVNEPDADAENLGSGETVQEAERVHEPVLSASTLISQRHKLPPAENLGISDSQRSRAQKALVSTLILGQVRHYRIVSQVTPYSKLVPEPDEKAPLKTSFTHVSDSETRETPFSFQSDYGRAPSQIENGFDEGRKNLAQDDYMAMRPEGVTKSAAPAASLITQQEESKMPKQESAPAVNMAHTDSSTEDINALFLPNLAPAPVRMAISRIILGLGTQTSQQGTPAKAQGEQPPYEKTDDQKFTQGSKPVAADRTPLSKQERVPWILEKKRPDQLTFQPVAVTDEHFSKDHSGGQETGGSFKEQEPQSVHPLEASLFREPSHVTKSGSATAAFRSQYSASHDFKEKPAQEAKNLRDISLPARQITMMRKPKLWNFELLREKPSFKAHYGFSRGIEPKEFSQDEDSREKISTRQQTFSKPSSYPGDIYRQEYKPVTTPQTFLQPLQWRDRVVHSGAPVYASRNGESVSIDQQQGLRKEARTDPVNRQMVESDKLHFMATVKPLRNVLEVSNAKTMPFAPLDLDDVSIARTLLQRDGANGNVMNFGFTKRPGEEVTVRRSQQLFLPLEQTAPGSSPREFHAKVLANVAPAYVSDEEDASAQRRTEPVKPDRKAAQSEPVSQLQRMLGVGYKTVEGQNEDVLSQSEYRGTTEKMRAVPLRPVHNTELPTLNQYQATSLGNRTRVRQPEYNGQGSAQYTTTYAPAVSDTNLIQTSPAREAANILELDREMNLALQNANLQPTSKKSPEQEKNIPYEPPKIMHQEQLPKDDQSSLSYGSEPSAKAVLPERSRIGYRLGKPSAFKVDVKEKEGITPRSRPVQALQSSFIPVTGVGIANYVSTPKTEKSVNEKTNERIVLKQKSHQWESLTHPPFVPVLANEVKANSAILPGGSPGVKLAMTQKSASFVKPQFEQAAEESIQRKGTEPTPKAGAKVTTVPTRPLQPVTYGLDYASPKISLWGLHEKKWIDFKNGLREAALQTFAVTSPPWKAEVDKKKVENKVNAPSTSDLISPFNLAGKFLQAKLASFFEGKPLLADEETDRIPEPKPTLRTGTTA
ncbi:hypothetical protein TTRE_0000287901 [Trichuris trichiura]|uniref:Uncharacterized protein n=1 Tax=Trichuris trichiura TaxID=36087 RepID=A0A077Z453_TRITR|nr:hypothetical protein TTRE_0000287901 [Trichuris trichiura]